MRWGKNGCGYKSQPVYSAIREFGWNNIDHKIIKDKLSVESAVEIERDLIAKYKNLGICYNSSSGGEVAETYERKYKYKGNYYTPEELAEMSDIEGLTSLDIINRINNHGWTVNRAITQELQNRVNYYVYNGKTYRTGELFDLVKNDGIGYHTLANRLHLGWDIDRALSEPVHKSQRKLYEYNGKLFDKYQLAEISSVKNIAPNTIAERIYRGMSVEDAITRPLPPKSKHSPKKKKINTKKYNNKKNYNIIANRKYRYNNKMYSTSELLSICIDDNMTRQCITHRYKNGWSVWEIVNIPKGTTRKQFYKNEEKITHYANQQPSQPNLGKSRLEGSETNS